MSMQVASAGSLAAPAHDHGQAPCACKQQSLGAVPWLIAAAVVLFALNRLSNRRKPVVSNSSRP